MTTATPYVTIVEPVLEVTLICRGDAAPWRQSLVREGISLPPQQEEVEIILSAVETKYMGVIFRELSVSLRLDDTQVFLVHAFNSNRFFAWVERAWFRTPYYYGKLVVAPHYIQLSDNGQPHLEARLAESAAALECRTESNEWQIRLPAALRKESSKVHYFNARLEGDTQYYATLPNPPMLVFGSGLPASLLPLQASKLMVEKWLVRERAKHSKSQTLEVG